MLTGPEFGHKKVLICESRFSSQGILTRLFSEPSSLRFGLPGSESSSVRLK